MSEKQEFEIYVENDKGTTLGISVNENDSITTLKSKIKQKLGIKDDKDIQIVYNGDILENEDEKTSSPKKISDYEIENHCLINILVSEEQEPNLENNNDDNKIDNQIIEENEDEKEDSEGIINSENETKTNNEKNNEHKDDELNSKQNLNASEVNKKLNDEKLDLINKEIYPRINDLQENIPNELKTISTNETQKKITDMNGTISSSVNVGSNVNEVNKKLNDEKLDSINKEINSQIDNDARKNISGGNDISGEIDSNFNLGEKLKENETKINNKNGNNEKDNKFNIDNRIIKETEDKKKIITTKNETKINKEYFRDGEFGCFFKPNMSLCPRLWFSFKLIFCFAFVGKYPVSGKKSELNSKIKYKIIRFFIAALLIATLPALGLGITLLCLPMLLKLAITMTAIGVFLFVMFIASCFFISTKLNSRISSKQFEVLKKSPDGYKLGDSVIPITIDDSKEIIYNTHK